MAKECRICKDEIPPYIMVDGKRRNLKNRTLCFDCLPFKSGRYVKMNNCGFCGEETKNPKFCSKSCAAKANNNRKGTGKNAGKEIPECKTEGCSNKVQHLDSKGHAGKQRKHCSECIAERRETSRANPKKGAPKKQSPGRPSLPLSELKSPGSIRRYLLRTRPHQCEECGLEEWQGEPAPLEVDHIDGDAHNNSEENLRLLCVTCHAQTPTWKFRSKRRGTRTKRMERYHAGKTW